MFIRACPGMRGAQDALILWRILKHEARAAQRYICPWKLSEDALGMRENSCGQGDRTRRRELCMARDSVGLPLSQAAGEDTGG